MNRLFHPRKPQRGMAEYLRPLLQILFPPRTDVTPIIIADRLKRIGTALRNRGEGRDA